jgi:hypothetical protein
VAFLTCTDNPEIDAQATFAGLKENPKRQLLDRFNHWIGFGVHVEWHHGWDTPPHDHCYCFRWYQRGDRHRLYGFLFHPTVVTNRAFQVCILVSHGRKFQQDTDPRQLSRATKLRADPEVVAAIKKTFVEAPKSKRSAWPIN